MGTGREAKVLLDKVGARTIRLNLFQGGITDSATVQVTVLQDYDGDAMPNDWELTYKLNPMDPSDATEDSDGDELSNLAEYRLGTDPTKADTDGDGGR